MTLWWLSLLSPIWLFLLVPLGLSLFLWRPPTWFLFGVRAVSLLLVVLALTGVALRLPSRAGTVVVVADRSKSMPKNSDRAMLDTIEMVRSAMGGDDQLAVVSFGQHVAVERAAGVAKFSEFQAQVGGDASSLGEALDTALSLIPRDTPGRILVLSDGKWTARDPATVAPAALARGVAIDYRAVERPAAGDLAIARIDAPTVVSAGESYLITGWVFAPTPQAISYALKRGGVVIASGERQLNSGENRLTFRDRATQVGNQGYTLEVRPKDSVDPVPENNTARLLVGVSGPRPLLHVSDSASSGLAALLRRGGLDVRSARPAAVNWTLQDLSRYSAVVLENVPAEKLGHVGMETLAAWVRTTGSGLLMTGGKSSFGQGGYYKSALEPILPVSMELRHEHRKLRLAIVVALDRSGSMAAPVSGGRRKMDLANVGTAQVLDILGPQDEFGCIAVDTAVHTIAPMGPVKDRERVRRDILSIQSMGGGIYVYEALAAASKMLLKAKAGTKHIILFSDAADSEEPGRYKELLEQCGKAGITVSVIGLGTEGDVDAELLKDIARCGKGRIFFTDKAEELPRLFAQDTFVVARNTFLEDEKDGIGVQHTPGLTTLTDVPLPSPAGLRVHGYNLCYLRPGATLGTVTLDEYRAPLAASWRVGAGRVVCYTGEADGRFAGPMARWDRAGDYYTSLARWAAGAANPLPSGMLLTQQVREGMNVVRLHLDPERKGDPFTRVPRAATLRGWDGVAPRTEQAALRWTGADVLQIELPLDGGETTLTTVDVEGHGPVPLPPVCLPYSPEFKPAQRDRGLVTLERLGRATGGRERVDLANIWDDLPRATRFIPISRWLLLAAVCLWLVEVFERRTGLLSAMARPRRRAAEPEEAAAERPAKAKPAALPKAEAAPAEKPAAVQAPPAVAASKADDGGMLDALRQARRRAKGRTD